MPKSKRGLGSGTSNSRSAGKTSRTGSKQLDPKTEEVVVTTTSPAPKPVEGRLLTSRKFLLCVAVLVASFLLVLWGKDVRSLEIIWPATLAVYFGANVSQDFAFRRTQRSRYESFDRSEDIPSRDLSDLRRKR